MLEGKTHWERIRAGIPVLIIHAFLAFALLRSLVLEIPALQPVLQLVEVPPSLPPPPPPVQQVRERSPRAEGASAPPNLEARPTEIVAPTPVLPPPPTIAAAPIAGPGDKPSSGAAPVPGPGTGAGGEGNGPGAGGDGDGPGGGGRGGDIPPRQIRGRISDRDYPRGAVDDHSSGRVSVIYTIEADGRATNCTITRSSGSQELDETTCRLIEQRFVFEPSRDRSGRPVRSRMVQDHIWEVQDVGPDPDEDRPPPRRRRWPF